MWEVVAAIVPSAGILFLFWRALKAMIEADRRERAAEARWNREHGITPARPAAARPGDTAGAGDSPDTGDAGDTADANDVGDDRRPAAADAAADAAAAETSSPTEGGPAAR